MADFETFGGETTKRINALKELLVYSSQLPHERIEVYANVRLDYYHSKIELEARTYPDLVGLFRLLKKEINFDKSDNGVFFLYTNAIFWWEDQLIKIRYKCNVTDIPNGLKPKEGCRIEKYQPAPDPEEYRMVCDLREKE